jgi:hypothetical protein
LAAGVVEAAGVVVDEVLAAELSLLPLPLLGLDVAPLVDVLPLFDPLEETVAVSPSPFPFRA